MQRFPLQLKGYFISEFHFETNKDYAPKDPEQETGSSSISIDQTDLGVDVKKQRHRADPLESRFIVTIVLNNSPKVYPCTFRVTLDGFFRLDKECPADLQNKITDANGPALLYSAARELIFNISMRGYYGPLVLPVITFANPPKATTGEQSNSEASEKKAKGKIKKPAVE